MSIFQSSVEVICIRCKKNSSINYKKAYLQAVMSMYIDRSKVQVPDILGVYLGIYANWRFMDVFIFKEQLKKLDDFILILVSSNSSVYDLLQFWVSHWKIS
jgi:hypothetical protein